MTQYQIKFFPPPGVNIQQTREGMLIINYQVADIAPFREKLETLRIDLLRQALENAEAKRSLEITRQQLPQDRLSILDAEIGALKGQLGSTAAPVVTAPAGR